MALTLVIENGQSGRTELDFHCCSSQLSSQGVQLFLITDISVYLMRVCKVAAVV